MNCDKEGWWAVDYLTGEEYFTAPPGTRCNFGCGGLFLDTENITFNHLSLRVAESFLQVLKTFLKKFVKYNLVKVVY